MLHNTQLGPGKFFSNVLASAYSEDLHVNKAASVRNVEITFTLTDAVI